MDTDLLPLTVSPQCLARRQRRKKHRRDMPVSSRGAAASYVITAVIFNTLDMSISARYRSPPPRPMFHYIRIERK